MTPRALAERASCAHRLCRGHESAALLAIKGMPLTVLVALRLVRKPMRNLDLQNFLLLDDRTIARACSVLEANELVAKGAQGWALTAAGAQLDFFTNIAKAGDSPIPPLINPMCKFF